MQQSIQQAMDQLRKDPRRLKAMYGTLQRRVRSIAGRYRPFVDEDMLNDACHDALTTTVVQYQGNFQAPISNIAVFDDALLGYLFNAARNRLNSALRKNDRARRLFFDGNDLESDQVEAHVASASPWLPDASTAPDIVAHARQRQQILHDCMAGLTKLARRTFLLALRGFNDQDIQRELDVASASTVRRRVHDAKMKLIACVRAKQLAGTCG